MDRSNDEIILAGKPAMKQILEALISVRNVDDERISADPMTGAIAFRIKDLPWTDNISIFYGRVDDFMFKFPVDDLKRHFSGKGIANEGFAVQGPLPPIPFRTFGELREAIQTVIRQMTDMGIGQTFPDDEEVTEMKHIMAAVRLEPLLNPGSVRHDFRNCLTFDFVAGPRGSSRGIAVWASARAGGPTVEGGHGPNYFENFGELKSAVRRATKQAIENKEEVDEDEADEGAADEGAADEDEANEGAAFEGAEDEDAEDKLPESAEEKTTSSATVGVGVAVAVAVAVGVGVAVQLSR